MSRRQTELQDRDDQLNLNLEHREDEPLSNLCERWNLHYVADPATPRKPCAAERGLGAKSDKAAWPRGAQSA